MNALRSRGLPLCSHRTGERPVVVSIAGFPKPVMLCIARVWGVLIKSGGISVKKGEKKKQRKALARRQEERRAGRAVGPMTVRGLIRQAREYPIAGCWTMDGWQKAGIAVVVVARRQPNGNIVFGCYMVDCYCLGLKNTFCNADIPAGAFHRDYLPKMFRESRPVPISPALAHEIIYGGIEYAARFGFRPQRDFKDSQYILDLPDQHPRSGTVEFGKDGKPFYIQGPYDNVDAIIRQLKRTAGEGNYHFLVQIAGPPPDL